MKKIILFILLLHISILPSYAGDVVDTVLFTEDFSGGSEGFSRKWNYINNFEWDVDSDGLKIKRKEDSENPSGFSREVSLGGDSSAPIFAHVNISNLVDGVGSWLMKIRLTADNLSFDLWSRGSRPGVWTIPFKDVRNEGVSSKDLAWLYLHGASRINFRSIIWTQGSIPHERTAWWTFDESIPWGNYFLKGKQIRIVGNFGTNLIKRPVVRLYESGFNLMKPVSFSNEGSEGVMRDDGENGDTSANDGLWTVLWTPNNSEKIPPFQLVAEIDLDGTGGEPIYTRSPWGFNP